MKNDKRTQNDIQRGSRIKAQIHRIGHDQSSFAQMLNMSQSTISKYCSGHIAPSDEALKVMCEKFSVSSDFLLYGIESEIIIKHQPHQIAKTLIHEQTIKEDQDMTLTKTLIENLQKLNEMLMQQAQEASKERSELKAENAVLKEQIKHLANEIEQLKNSFPNKPFVRTSNGQMPGE